MESIRLRPFDAIDDQYVDSSTDVLNSQSKLVGQGSSERRARFAIVGRHFG